MWTAVVAVAFLSPALQAQVLTSTPRGVVVAHDGRVELVGGWTVDGVEHATSIIAGEKRVAVLDALNDEVVVVDLESGRRSRMATAETPIDAVFVGDELYVLARDARSLQHGSIHTRLAADPAFLRQADGKLYVYSRAEGVIEEIEGDRVTRRVSVAPFASDFEISGAAAWLVYPRESLIRTVDLEHMEVQGSMAVGAVPVDVAFAGGGTAVTARILAVADPSSKRVWMAESTQSPIKAFGRGFLRAFVGMGLFSNRSSEFPTGIDRVEIEGSRWIAYDSSSGTLYRFSKRKSSVIATNVAPGAFALTPAGVAWWNGTSVAQKRLE